MLSNKSSSPWGESICRTEETGSSSGTRKTPAPPISEFGTGRPQVLHVKAVGGGAEVSMTASTTGSGRVEALDDGQGLRLGLRLRFRGGVQGRSRGAGGGFFRAGVLGGEEVKAIVLAKFALLDLIAEGGQLFPVAVGAGGGKGRIRRRRRWPRWARRELPSSLRFEGDFRDARQALPQLQAVLRRGSCRGGGNKPAGRSPNRPQAARRRQDSGCTRSQCRRRSRPRCPGGGALTRGIWSGSAWPVAAS